MKEIAIPLTWLAIFVILFLIIGNVNYSWIEHEGKHYCPDCYEYDMNEEIVIKQIANN